MATNVRLKDAAGNVLHPETDWSVVQNKPSISVDQTSHVNEVWNFGGYIDIMSGYGIRLTSSGAKIKITDQNTGGEKTLDEYPIKYSALTGAPTFYTDSTTYGCIGLYKNVNYQGRVYQSIACQVTDTTGDSVVQKYYYLSSSGSWATFTPYRTGEVTVSFTPLSLLAKR